MTIASPLFIVIKRMKYRSLLVALVGAMVMAVASCTGSDDYTVISVAPSTCVITDVEMGKIPCTVRTKTVDGKDSTYIATITGSNYPMSIDHLGGRIFNVDSLPYGCDAAKVTFSSLASSGSLAINSVSQQDVDTFFVATDSTDLRQPRKVTVYAPNGIAKRIYWLEVRVHQEEGNAFVWQTPAEGVTAFANLEFTASLANEGSLFVYGVENGQPVVMKALASAPAEWTKASMDKAIAAPVVYEGSFYALADGHLVQSADGVNWAAVTTTLTNPLLTLVAGSTALYGVTADGFVTSVNGTDWALQDADEPANLPLEKCAAACLPSPTDAMFEDIIVVGTRDGRAVVWKLNVDKSGMYSYEWNYYPEMDINPSPCPELAQRQIFAYDGATLLLGAQDDGTNVVRLSRDNGRTWEQKEIPQLEGVSGAWTSAVDANHFVWVITQDGKVLKGRFNRLGWAQQDKE